MEISREKLHEAIRAEARELIRRARKEAYEKAAEIAGHRDPILAKVFGQIAEAL